MDRSEIETLEYCISTTVDVLLKTRARTWGGATQEQATRRHLVFFTARGLWGLSECYPHLREIRNASFVTAAKAAIKSEARWLVQAGILLNRQGKCCWFSSDTDPFEPTKTTAAVLMALLSVLRALMPIREEATGDEFTDLIRHTVAGAASWLRESMTQGVETIGMEGPQGLKYHVRRPSGWPTIPLSLQEELADPADSTIGGPYQKAIEESMGIDCKMIRFGLPWWTSTIDPRATKESLRALSRFQMEIQRGSFPPETLRVCGGANWIPEVLGKAVQGLGLTQQRNGGWTEVLCENFFTSAAIASAVPCLRFTQQRHALRTAMRTTRRIRLAKTKVGEDVCLLSSLAHVTTYLGREWAVLPLLMKQKLAKAVGHHAKDVLGQRPDYLGCLAVASCSLYFDSGRSTRLRLAWSSPLAWFAMACRRLIESPRNTIFVGIAALLLSGFGYTLKAVVGFSDC